jgi:fumarate hydratase subunit alpha
MDKDVLRKAVSSLVQKAAFEARPDVADLLSRFHQDEKEPAAKRALAQIIENFSVARGERLAICQDTGLPMMFVTIGRGVMFDADDAAHLRHCVAQEYAACALRQSAVDPLDRERSGYDGVLVHTDYDATFSGIRLTLLCKGFGSENKTQLKMFNPTASVKEIEEFVVDAVRKAGPDACPPYVVGVGIGGMSDVALHLAKEAYLHDLREEPTDGFLAALEQRLLAKVNALGVGPMGLGGGATALAVKVKKCKTHIAGLPVGVNINCWATRSASVVL